jgi:PAS domain S-box-containing protein/putative nucleotidyltransferase with HDIG domain
MKEARDDMTTKELIELENYINAIWQFLPLPIAYVTPLGVIVHIDDACEKLFEVRQEGIIGQTLADFCVPTEHITRIQKQTLDFGFVRDQECILRNKTGKVIPVSISTLARRDEYNEVIGFFIAFVDIAHRKEIETTVRASEEKYRAAVEQSAEGIYILDIETKRVLEANAALMKLIGYSLHELRDLSVYDFFAHPHEEIDRDLQTIIDKKSVFIGERQYRHKDGSLVTVEISGSHLTYGGTKALNILSRDITEQKHAHELQMVLYNIANLVITTDNLKELFGAIRTELGTILDTSNFYIAVYNENDDTISLPFYIDEKDHFDTFPAGKTLTAHVIKKSRPLLATRETIEAMKKSGEIESFGAPSRVWLGVPLKIENNVIGALVVQSYSDPLLYTEKDLEILKFVSGQVALAVERKKKEQQLQSSYTKLKTTMENTIYAIASLVELRDPYTAGHQRRVAELAHAIATAMHLPEGQKEAIRMAAMIHDIGKINIPAEILTKPTELTEPEFDIVKIHPQIAYDVLKKISFPRPIADIVLQHHERLDGSGYPQGLKGNGIMLEARILCLADVVEAMSSYRPYRPAMGIEATLSEISKKQNILYDRAAVQTCLKLFTEQAFAFEHEVH